MKNHLWCEFKDNFTRTLIYIWKKYLRTYFNTVGMLRTISSPDVCSLSAHKIMVFIILCRQNSSIYGMLITFVNLVHISTHFISNNTHPRTQTHICVMGCCPYSIVFLLLSLAFLLSLMRDLQIYTFTTRLVESKCSVFED